MSNKEMVSTETENKGQRKVFLPNKLLECLPRLSSLPNERLRWNTNEEIASYLISFERHDEWLSCTLKTRPKNGSIVLYNRKKVKYRKDGYCWKKRKDGKTTREDHMKLKVQGMECLYGCYVHSSIVPTFHRRCYWLLQNPDIVLVHYLNVPSLEDSGKCSPLLCAVADRHDSVRWSRDDLLSQLKPMFHSTKCSVSSGDFSIEELVQHILERQRTKPQPRTHSCLCNTSQVSSGGNIPHRCNSTKHRIISPKLPPSCTPPTPPLGPEGGEAGRAAGGGGGGGGGEAKVPVLQAQSSPVPSPCPSSTSAPSPPRPHSATITISNHANGLYGDHRGNLTTVALPQNAVLVMATATAISGGGGQGGGGEETEPGRSLSLTRSGQLLLSPALPPPAGGAASPSPPPSLPPAPAQAPGVATLSLTLLPSPVIGGLLLAPPSSSLRSPPSPTTASPPSPPSTPPPPPPSLPPAFDPDSFLNSPKQGQTYGGPPPPCPSRPSPVLCSSSSPLSPPSLALSLSPTSTPPSSVSPPSSLSSLSSSSSSSDADRRDSSSLPLLSSSSSPPPPSSSLPPSLSLSPTSSSSVAPPLLPPLCLELGALGGSEGVRQEEARGEEEEEKRDAADDDDDDDDEGSAPPTKLALLQTSHASSCSSPRQQSGSSAASLLLVCQESTSRPAQPANQTQPLAPGPPFNQPSAPEAPPPAQTSHQPLRHSQSAFVNAKAPSLGPGGTDTSCAPAAVAMDTTHPPTPPVQVKEERRRSYESEDACMDTHLEGAEPCERGGEELDICFDSQFPDLISDLIAEDANPAVAPPAAAAAAPNPALFPTGVRYMVPPQPSPSSSFLPFPHPLPSSSSTRLAAITDFSPEWSYPEGGVKVLITGPWSEVLGRYSCVFDQSTVPASLIQPGVLRCYCPAHQAGLVCLQVLDSGGSVSSSVLFEYRARNASSLPSSQLDWLSLDDNQFRMSILERLEQMERRMAEMAARDHHHHHHHQQHQQHHGNQLATPPPPPLPEDHTQSSQWFERRIVGVCERMMRGGRWGGGGEERLHHSVRHRGMTLLHLAAAQGYTHLIHTLIHWRSVNSDSLDLEQEVDPLNIDHFSCTPLMWACALGHHRAAELLYGWNSSALGIPDSLGRLPLAVARSRGHTLLATALEELHTHTHMTPRDTHSPPTGTHTPATPQPQLPPSPPSTSPDTGLSSSSSLPSPSGPSSPSPSSAYSSGPAPMDTSPSSLSSPSSSSSASLPVSPPSPSSLPPVSMWGEEPGAGLSAGLNAGGSRDSPLYLMDYESACPPSPAHTHAHTASGRRAHTAAVLEEQLLRYSENAENEGVEEEYLEEEVLQVDMATLAEQIIEATPERIKQEDFSRGAESPLRERRDNPAIQDTWLATYLDTVDAHTHSPPRRLCPPSPLSALALQRLRPPSSAAWAEFLNASANGKIERDFALLTLTDGEQRELYEAARIIQNAFRRYKGRRLKEQQDVAAAVIQRCYRKYKQYALYKKMTQAAILIQSKFRSYYEQKRFQQSRRAAVLIQQYYRSYKEYERLKQAPRGAAGHSAKIKGSFLTKKQDQAARKIMRFLRRCRHRIKELKQTRELERRGLTT